MGPENRFEMALSLGLLSAGSGQEGGEGRPRTTGSCPSIWDIPSVQKVGLCPVLHPWPESAQLARQSRCPYSCRLSNSSWKFKDHSIRTCSILSLEVQCWPWFFYPVARGVSRGSRGACSILQTREEAQQYGLL